MDKTLLRSLGALGFSEYEAKVYGALLRDSPASGYAVARLSGVPRSKVYEVLDSLVSRGDVLASHGEPVQYAPRPPREVIDVRRRALERDLGSAEKSLEAMSARGSRNDLIWDIVGREHILYRARDLVARATGVVLLQAWSEEAGELRQALEQAAARGVVVTIVAYGDPGLPFAQVYLHEPGVEEITRDYGGRWLLVSRDGQEIVAGIVSMGDESRAAWSSHPGVVMPMTEQIKHDVYISEMLHTHREALEASFGPGLRDLRSRIGPSPRVYRPPYSA